MKIKDISDHRPKFKKEIPIGVEIDLLDEKGLILGLVEAEATWEGEYVIQNKLLVLHTGGLDDEEWDDDCDEEVGMTNRQALVAGIEEEDVIEASDIDSFVVNGRSFETQSYETSFLEEEPFESVMLIEHFLKAGCIPESWQNKELDELVLAEYEMEEDIYEVNWKADILQVSVCMAEPFQEFLLEKTITFSLGRFDVPKSYMLEGHDGEEIEVKFHGVYLHNIWTDPVCLEEDFYDLEEYCAKDERLLVVEYETADNLDIDIYTKKYLDANEDEDDGVDFILMNVFDEGKTQRQVLEVVPENFDEEVEIEILSYSYQ